MLHGSKSLSTCSQVMNRWQDKPEFSDANGYYVDDLDIAAPLVGTTAAQLFQCGWAFGQVTRCEKGAYVVEYDDGHTAKFGSTQLLDLKQALLGWRDPLAILHFLLEERHLIRR